MSDLKKRYDAIVVGSGATGSIAVKELTERGLEVLLVEGGPDISEADFLPPQEQLRPRPMGVNLWPRVKAGLRGQHVQSRRAFYSPRTNPFLVNDREHPYSTPPGQYFLWIRGHMLGGRLNTYGRMLLRMSEFDFGGDDTREPWPISYADVEPWYDRIEEFIGIYGNEDDLPYLPNSRYVGPGYLTAVEREFRTKVEQRWPERRVISWRYAAPNPHRVPRGIRAARETGRLTTLTDSLVTRVTTDERTGRATGVTYVNRLTRQEGRAEADVVVLCASTIESIRLLLNSASSKHPSGLGNSSGLLGRYFMDQTPSLTFGDCPTHLGWEADTTAPPDDFYPPAGGIYVPRFDNLATRTDDSFTTGMAFQGAMGRIPVPDDHPATFGLMGYGEMLAYRENSVSLHPSRRDKWGVPIPHISLTLHENERALLTAQVRASREMLEQAGFRVNFAGSSLGLDSPKVWPNADPFSRWMFRLNFRKSVGIGAAIHECGGARMGTDPATSVLNQFNQSWDVPNLFVTDASCYVSNGMVGPTLTIMALTARACEYIAKEHAQGAGLAA